MNVISRVVLRKGQLNRHTRYSTDQPLTRVVFQCSEGFGLGKCWGYGYSSWVLTNPVGLGYTQGPTVMMGHRGVRG